MAIHPIPRDQYFRLDRNDVAAMVPVDCRTVLEIGSGFGVLGRALIDRQGCTVDGVEINPAAAPHLQAYYRRYWIGDVEHVELDGSLPEYECLLFPDVLEHLVDPWAAMEHYSRMVKQGGCIVASIPNIRNLAILYRLIVQGRWEYEDSGLLDRGHLRFFTRQSIDDLFSQNGFRVEQWHLNRDRYHGVRRFVSAAVKIFAPEIDVCQYIVRARKP
jgi:SAM-dependent methyltransferase